MSKEQINSEIIREWNELIERFGSYEIRIIFQDVHAYSRVREYTSYHDVRREITLITVE